MTSNSGAGPAGVAEGSAGAVETGGIEGVSCGGTGTRGLPPQLRPTRGAKRQTATSS
ncbi:MAG: hypothetical protein ACE1ZI_04900 [Acidobacteriota bacterium]